VDILGFYMDADNANDNDAVITSTLIKVTYDAATKVVTQTRLNTLF